MRYNGSDFFMIPDSGILTGKANRVDCGLVVKPIHKADGVWYISDGKSLRPYCPSKMIPYQQKTHITFMNLYVKNFDQNGLYTAMELEITHKLFFQAHEIKLVNDDFGEGLYHADNTFSYDLSSVSSSNGFLNWEITLVSFPMLLMLLCTPSWFLSAFS